MKGRGNINIKHSRHRYLYNYIAGISENTSQIKDLSQFCCAKHEIEFFIADTVYPSILHSICCVLPLKRSLFIACVFTFISIWW